MPALTPAILIKFLISEGIDIRSMDFEDVNVHETLEDKDIMEQKRLKSKQEWEF